jgi:SAM-dependent methyltransferase
VDLKDVQRLFDRWGATDPLWAVLSWPRMRGNRWEPERFFRTGVDEIARVLGVLRAVDLPLRFGRALDFGCGVGRLTQALALHFEEVWGVDIAPSMVRRAEAYNRHGNRCRYIINESPNLRLFADGMFDFIYTNLTLQHLEPQYAKGYMSDFLRIAAPRGVVVFHQPSGHRVPDTLGGRVRRWLKPAIPGALLGLYRTLRRLALREVAWEIHGIPREDVVDLVGAHGGRVVHVEEEFNPRRGWTVCAYYVTKSPERC